MAAREYKPLEDGASADAKTIRRKVWCASALVIGGCMAGTAYSMRALVRPVQMLRAPNITASTALEELGCETQTGGTCGFFGCDANRHATCSSFHCVCGSGSCNINGQCQKLDVCEKITLGSCKLLSCGWSRGPSFCNAQQECECLSGFCSHGDACRLTPPTFEGGVTHALTAKVMAHSNPTTISSQAPSLTQQRSLWPSRHGSLKTALCISGGGMRSLTLGMGVLRALRDMNLMDSVDALSGVSGGAWTAALYTYTASLDKLLGRSLLDKADQPTDLDLNSLDWMDPIYVQVASKSMTNFATRLLSHWPLSKEEMWDIFVDVTVLEPADLSGKARWAFLAQDDAQVESIKARNPDIKARNADFLTPEPGRPLLVVSATTLGPLGFTASGDNTMSLQFSPDFSGVPFAPALDQLDFAPMSAGPLDAGANLSVKMVGGLVETFAFGGEAPAQGPSSEQLEDIDLPVPELPLSLRQVLGASSDALAAALGQYHGVSATVPQIKLWPLAPGPQETHTFKLGDGGSRENAGVLPMLQRGLDKIVWLVNTDTGVSQEFDFCAHGSKPSVYGNITNQFYDKFGFGTDAASTGFLKRNHVFPRDDLFRVACQVQQLRQNGKPAIFTWKHEVLRNEYWGILGGWEVEILYVFNDLCEDFMKSLPIETQKEVDQGVNGEFPHFPFYNTIHEQMTELTAYTPKEVNLLSAMAEYGVRRNAAQFKAFLQPQA